MFFPGCTFAGTRAEAVLAMHDLLRRSLPRVGIVLDCCTKPSHDLGRQAYFLAMFGEMKDFLVAQGVRTVLVACPNCYKVFQSYGSPLQVRTIYERLTEEALPRQDLLRGTVTLHDPCVLRHEPAVQDAVRSLVHHVGLQVMEMPNSRERTLCCGEGGGVGVVAPELARQWSVERARQAEKHPVVTSCAGCAAQLRRFMPTVHVVDLLLDGQRALAGKARVARSPFTYWKRLRLKKALKQRLSHTRLCERPLQPGAQ
uniref:(Fe-S)-binding protein n=1 Tax=Desulfacinum infernum TaxID=35837 RepID=A0A831ZJ36_9BACT